MINRVIAVVLPAGLALVSLVVLVFWLHTGPAASLVLREPGMEGPGLDRGQLPGTAEALFPPVAGQPQQFDGKPSDLPGAWPCFRGANRDGICDDGVPLARKWPEEGPEVLWRLDLLGPGHAGAAVSAGRVYVVDYDEEAEADTMRCLSLDDGKEIWRNSYPVELPDSHGMSRTVPAVVDDYVLSLGPKCHVACWNAETGQCLWLLDLVLEYGARFPDWYAGQCPLVEGGRLILAPVGKEFLMIAVDCASGQVVWKTEKPPALRSWQMTHVSIAPVQFMGRRMYVYCGSHGVAGVAADDGSLLWHSTAWVGKMATCPTPVPVGDGRIFFCGGYGAGSLMMQLEAQGDRLAAEPLFRLTPRQFGSEHHTPIFFDGHLYGVRTKAGGAQLACIDLDGKEAWNSGTQKFGRGPYLFADGLIYVMNDDGRLTMAEATPDEYRPLGQFQVFDNGRDAWGPMALVAGRLIVRDLTRMACLNVAERSASNPPKAKTPASE